jgi:hypothetical protein
MSVCRFFVKAQGPNYRNVGLSVFCQSSGPNYRNVGLSVFCRFSKKANKGKQTQFPDNSRMRFKLQHDKLIQNLMLLHHTPNHTRLRFCRLCIPNFFQASSERSHLFEHRAPTPPDQLPRGLCREFCHYRKFRVESFCKSQQRRPPFVNLV